MAEQVSSMLLTIQQFITLENAGIDELDVMFTAFQQAVDFLKTQPYDILDFVETGKAFDKDFEEFTEKITVIEVAMRDFISQTFEEVQNIELALDLLSKLEVILQRDSLKGDLEDKYSLIFQHYGDQLEHVQLVYEGQKANPPLSRNLPPVLHNANPGPRYHVSSVLTDSDSCLCI
jgi:dynein heavy chain